MPRGSRPGEHRGGRKLGTPNRATADVIAKLEALGCDPIEGMARVAMDEGKHPRAARQDVRRIGLLHPPKRKAIDHSSDGSMSGGVTGIRVEFVRLSGPSAARERARLGVAPWIATGSGRSSPTWPPLGADSAAGL